MLETVLALASNLWALLILISILNKDSYDESLVDKLCSTPVKTKASYPPTSLLAHPLRHWGRGLVNDMACPYASRTVWRRAPDLMKLRGHNEESLVDPEFESRRPHHLLTFRQQ